MHRLAQNGLLTFKNQVQNSPKTILLNLQKRSMQIVWVETHESYSLAAAATAVRCIFSSKRWVYLLLSTVRFIDISKRIELRKKIRHFAHFPWTISKNALKPVSIEINLLSLRWSVDISNNVLSLILFFYTLHIFHFQSVLCAYNIYKNKDEPDKKTELCKPKALI